MVGAEPLRAQPPRPGDPPQEEPRNAATDLCAAPGADGVDLCRPSREPASPPPVPAPTPQPLPLPPARTEGSFRDERVQAGITGSVRAAEQLWRRPVEEAPPGTPAGPPESWTPEQRRLAASLPAAQPSAPTADTLRGREAARSGLEGLPALPPGADREVRIDQFLQVARLDGPEARDPEVRRRAEAVLAAAGPQIKWSDIYALRARLNLDAAAGAEYTRKYGGEGWRGTLFRAQAAVAGGIDKLGDNPVADFVMDMLPGSGLALEAMQFEPSSAVMAMGVAGETTGFIPGCKLPGVKKLCKGAGDLATRGVVAVATRLGGDAAVPLAQRLTGKALREATAGDATVFVEQIGRGVGLKKGLSVAAESGQTYYRGVSRRELERVLAAEGALVPRVYNEAGRGFSERLAREGPGGMVLAHVNGDTRYFTSLTTDPRVASVYGQQGAVLRVAADGAVPTHSFSRFGGSLSGPEVKLPESERIVAGVIAPSAVEIYNPATSAWLPIASPEGRAVACRVAGC